MPLIHRAAVAAVAAGMTAAAGLAMAPAAGATAHQPSFIGQFHRLRTIGSTVPRNGDVNPYGMVAIRHTRGKLRRGHVLISNFNNKANLQGTGTTIVEISPRGHRTRFAHISASRLPGACPGGVGLTTALAVVHGWVIVGSLPTSNGMSATARAGCLIVLNSHGRVRETFSGHGINGPWDMTSLRAGRFAELFVTNVLNGTVAANGAVVHQRHGAQADAALPARPAAPVGGDHEDRFRLCRAHRPGSARRRSHRRRARPQRHPVRRGQRDEPDHRDPGRAVAA